MNISKWTSNTEYSALCTHINVFTDKKSQFRVESHTILYHYSSLCVRQWKNAHVIDPVVISLRIASFFLFLVLDRTHNFAFILGMSERENSKFFVLLLYRSRVSYHDEKKSIEFICIQQRAQLIVWRMANDYLFGFVSMAKYLFLH